MKNLTSLMLTLVCILTGFTTIALPKLNSLNSATATIYLDMDGHTVTSALWNNGNPIYCASPLLTDAQATEIFNRVAEDFRPFNVNITTDSAKFLSAPLTQRIRIIVTPTSAWKPNVGGVSFIGSFTWGDDTPGFVFSDRLGPNNTKFIAECCSHETGHTLGLSHQSKYDNNCNLTETYNTGIGNGETSWAPIMGNSYSRNMTGWNDGPTPYGCANTQDNLSIITNVNGFGYRTDDYSDSMNLNAFTPSSTSFSIDGIITTESDKDVFRFVLPQLSNMHIDANPYNLGSASNGADLDIKVLLYDGTNNILIRTYDPANTMGLSIDTTLKGGTYYFVLDGTGNGNASGYGSLGGYTFTGFRSALPIRSVNLSGTADKYKHQLNWNVVSEDALSAIVIEYSTNGTDFNILNANALTGRSMSYNPMDANTRYYRVKAISQTQQVMYSNVIALKGTDKAEKTFTVSTFTSSSIQVIASENFQYRIMDMNGRALMSGKGSQGVNQINWNNQSAGIYVIQLFGINNKQSERIIKQ